MCWSRGTIRKMYKNREGRPCVCPKTVHISNEGGDKLRPNNSNVNDNRKDAAASLSVVVAVKTVLPYFKAGLQIHVI